MSKTVAELKEEYMALAHAMQTGVATEMNFNPKPIEPKHLRVGINSAMVSDAALGRLLIAKGIFTELEYHEALVEAMKAEVAEYERLLSVKYGTNIKLS